MKISLLITTYNDPVRLKKTLSHCLRLRPQPAEILVCDDGSRPDTGELIRSFARNSSTPVLHVFQDDHGWDAPGIRNLGAIAHFRGSPLRKIGDFSLNVANPLTAEFFIDQGLERVTVSYDLNISQVLDLLAGAPPEWFELTIHQHMPMFHMEHCVFAAFMSNGKDSTDCGRPCEKHRVSLRDRVGMEHPLRADVGCRNTLFNAVPQTGAKFFAQLEAAGLRQFRLELLDESAADSRQIIRAYQSLLSGETEGEALWRSLKAQSQLGVTRGAY